MERRAPHCVVVVLVVLLTLLVAAARTATTSTTARSEAGTGQGSAFDGGGSDVENSTTTTLAPTSAASNNHSYEIRCWPRAQLLVDEAPVQVTRAFRAALRVLCVLARGAAQQSLNASAPDWNPRSPGYRFGHLVTEGAYDVSEYKSGAQGNKQFDVEFADGEPANSSDILAMFSYTCQYRAPGHQLALNERALRAGSAAWALLARLACREWWDARAPPDSAEDASAEDDSEERAMSAFRRRLRSALAARAHAHGTGEGEGDGRWARRRVRRVDRWWLLDNRVDALQPFSFPPTETSGASRNHSYDISCALHRERLFSDGVELQVSRHLQSLVRYVCAFLRPHGPLAHAHVHANREEPLHSLGYIVTSEPYDPLDYVRDSLTEKKFHVEYLDGRRRHGRHVFPVHVRCAGGASEVSVRGEPLAPRSLSWALLATARCGGAAPAHPPRAAPHDDAQEWRLQQQQQQQQRRPPPTRPSASPTPQFFNPPFNGNLDSWRMSVLFSEFQATTAGPPSTSSPHWASLSQSSSFPVKLPTVSGLRPFPPSSSSSTGSVLPSSESSFRSLLFSSFGPSTPAFSFPSTERPPSTTPFPTSFSSLSSSPSILKYPLISPAPKTPVSSTTETTVDPSSTSMPWSYLFPIPSIASTAESAQRTAQRIAPTRRQDDRMPHADWRQEAATHVMRDFSEDGATSEQGKEEVVVGDSEEVLPTPERLDSTSPNNTSEEYLDDSEDFHNHSYVLRCAESGALEVDGEEARVTSHMAAALIFLCALLSSAQGSRPTAYDFGSIRTVEAYRTVDVAVNGDGNGSLDVLYEGGALPRTLDVNIFWQTCRPDPPGPEFSLDSGPLLPRSVVWSLFSKVRCGADHEDTFPGAERYFGDDVAPDDRASEELVPSYSDRHYYTIRCSSGEEALVVDGLEVRLTKHMESALGLLCFSAGLHGHGNATRNLGRLRTVEVYNPEEYSLVADGAKRLDILYKDNINRCEERIFSMMPECQARPVRFEVNGREVRAGGLMWRLYRSLLCGAAAGDASAEDAAAAAGQMDEDEYQSPLYVASNVHNYAIRCRRGGERLLVDGVRVRASRHLLAVLRFLCDVIEVSTALPEGGVYSFGALATRDPFATAEFAARPDAGADHSARSFDVQYTHPTNRADRHPTSLRSICEPEAQFVLDGHRLAPHTLVWSLFHHLRCGELASSQPAVQA